MDIDNLKNNISRFISNNKIMILKLIIIILLILILIITIHKKSTKQNISVNNELTLLDNKIEEAEPIKEVRKINVDIKGAVSKPGVYSLEEGSIVDDVIKLAGGVNKNANTREINLSKKLKDEMVIVIYTNLEIQEFKDKKKESDKNECMCDNDINEACVKENYTNSYDYNSSYYSESYVSKDSESVNSIININTASLEELLTLAGIGGSKAKAIIEYRKENSFETIEDIMKVSGIGQSVFDKIKENITV